MMMTKRLCISLLLIGASTLAQAGQAYLDKFMAYMHWSQQLPTTPDPAFAAFIDTPSPLTQKLREKWLYQLAHNKDWVTYNQYYRDSQDINLQCYAQTALYTEGKQQQAIQASKALWLNGGSQPKACDELFTLLLNQHAFSDDLIRQRVALALEKNNLSLARYLLKQYKTPQLHEVDLITAIAQNPTRISQLEPSTLHGDFYAYGLKRMIPRHMDQAIALGTNAKAKAIMNDAQQQSFLAQVALYKAMRSEADTAVWFAKVKPAFYNDALLDWEIRFALSQHDWHHVINLISHSKEKEEPAWQYWTARAHESLGDKDKSTALYQAIATKRNYYGFLASLRLNKTLSFENEQENRDMQALQVYQPFIDQVKDLYTTHQSYAASRMLNDFSSELPKDERSALAYWVAHDLRWHGKSVYLSNNPILNNQLSLRFPLAYRDNIHNNAKQFQIRQEMIYAVIRQESAFHDDIVSPVGANGLMQIMPATAKAVAARAKILYLNTKELFLPQKNISIGTAYLQQLAKQFNEHPVLMAAAYNAGPRQVNYWLRNHPPKEIDLWIETLPWRETRNYLKNVIAFYAVYQYRMQEKPNLNAFMQPFK